jgi:hypothetical protein
MFIGCEEKIEIKPTRLICKKKLPLLNALVGTIVCGIAMIAIDLGLLFILPNWFLGISRIA